MNNLSRIIVNGGVLSPAELKYICESAKSLGFNSISFGSRQDILFSKAIDSTKAEVFERLQIIQPGSHDGENIISSYVATDIFPTTSWLTSGRYLYVLEQFRRQPKIKVNITDPKQRLVPLFTGHANFIASEHEDYWYLYIRLPQWTEMEMFPALIYSWDIDKIVFAIEDILQEEPDTIEMVFELVNDAVDTENRTVDKPLNVPFYPFPYYEGMNRIGQDKYWLGLYWRNNKYDLKFLSAMCDMCSDDKIGKISITPWKSFIIKGIPNHSKLGWEKFLGRNGINVRHSMLELNWHLPVADNEALALKKYLVNNFDKNDISTYGLTFAITNHIRKAYYFTSIVIEKNIKPDALKNVNIRDTYNLLYAKNFDPNTREYILYVQDVDKSDLSNLLMELSRLYFDELGTEKEAEYNSKALKDTVEEIVHQCKDCLTIYNELYGDITQNIQPNTPFESLPNTYKCALCEGSKSNFKEKILIKEV